MCQSAGSRVCCVCMCVCVCVCVCVCLCVCVWYQIRVPAKKRIMCQTSVTLTPCCIKHTSRSGTKVASLDSFRSIISLSKIAYQMWHDHTFSQRNKTSEKEYGLRSEVTWNRNGRISCTNFEKGRGTANIVGCL